jgi:threonine-phosphate decarboxylase
VLIIVTEDSNPRPFKQYLKDLSACNHGGLRGQISSRVNIPESDILDFSKSLNPLGNPFDYHESDLDLEEILKKAVSQFEQYPDNRYAELKTAAAMFLNNGVLAENIIPGNGSCELLRLVIECLAYEGDEVIVASPCPLEYIRICESFGIHISKVKNEDILSLSEDAIGKSKALLVSNPNNPTGKLLTKESLLELVAKCTKNETLLIIDESFIELSDDPGQTLTDIACNTNYLCVIRSITNVFSVPGVRFAYAVASSELSGILNSARLSWNIGAVAEQIAISILSMDGGLNSKYLHASRLSVRDERDYIMAHFIALFGFEPIESNVNYILVDMTDHFMDSSKLHDGFAEHGLLIRDCQDFFDGEKDHIRISVRPRHEFDVFFHKIDDVYAKYSKEEAREKLEETIEHGGNDDVSSRSNCNYYPCHFHGQDCTFCFCPFYPCDDERTGGKWIDSATGGKVWSCEFCNLLHQANNAKKVLDVLMHEGDTDENVEKAWQIVIEPYLEDSSNS